MSDEGEVLSGGNMGPVVRRGDWVHRVSGEWSPSVHALLRHCRAVGLRSVPEVRELTDDGHEVLGFIPGTVPAYPMPTWVWSRETLTSSARLLRELHDATIGCDPSGPWRSPIHEPVEVICHNDFAPYNCVYEDGRAVGVIDFDFASPGSRRWDLAYLAYRIVPLSTDTADGYSAHEREERLGALLSAYGTSDTPDELREMVVRRLLELASFSDTTAETHGNPELRVHAALYRKDAAALS
jgi:Phosphotransferase enzyme family